MIEQQGSALAGIGFVVNDKPFCLWGTRLESVNDEFVRHIDPAYFEYLAEIHFPQLSSPDTSHMAALALRNAYFHALETFFALLFAAIQAPTCVVGWMQKYQVRDIVSLIGKIFGAHKTYAMVTILATTGIRAGELVSMSVDRLELKMGTAWVNGKRHLARSVPGT